MYIDTRSKLDMTKSVINYLDISSIELNELFDRISRECSEHKYFDGVQADIIIDEYINKHRSEQVIDEILVFHLSYRRPESEDYSGRNLFDLLSNKSELSEFLREKDILFVPDGKKLRLFYKGEYISLDNTYETNVPYLRWRLGYNSRMDFCFNGFAFKDLIYKNDYTKDLIYGPELLNRLATYLNSPQLCQEYVSDRVYYCITYIVSINRICFDDDSSLSDDIKGDFLVREVLRRLYEYSEQEERYISDIDNHVIRTRDNDTIPNSAYLEKEVIPYEMLV
ncbi:hypothetical protein lbkm_0606 [Lachnospiraceae bacterium KM106-2]|nr:hypothetical protein lbkm_0606 [Lachnospiraceae bacterium KM106-2]